MSVCVKINKNQTHQVYFFSSVGIEKLGNDGDAKEKRDEQKKDCCIYPMSSMGTIIVYFIDLPLGHIRRPS